MMGDEYDDAALGCSVNLMDESLMQMQLNPVAFSSEMLATASVVTPSKGRDERVPHWGHLETKDLIDIRAQLERDSIATTRNKTLWEVVSAKMKERGYWRTPDQCKCKWKNLANKFKEKETSDMENGWKYPFFDELRALYTERAKNLHHSSLESEAGLLQARKKGKRMSGDGSSNDFSQGEGEDEDVSEDDRIIRSSNPRKRKPEREQQAPIVLNAKNSSISGGGDVGIKEMLREFLLQQQKMEMQWWESMERHACERVLFEQEWRMSMEKLERERLMTEQTWRDREDQRKMREESRAEKRDALLTTLLNMLIKGSDP